MSPTVNPFRFLADPGDVIDGRVDVAIGAGWNRPEYLALGLPFDPVGVRVAR